jgi:hypothetical protein
MCDIGDVPPPRLLEQRQFEAFAAQRALIDDRKVAPNWADEPIVRTVREANLGSADVIESVQVNPSPTGTPADKGEWRPCNAIRVNFCKRM